LTAKRLWAVAWVAAFLAVGWAGRVLADPQAADAAATPSQSQNQRFHASMDQVFGAGRWRETSGYRTQAQEDALRREGAGTVPAGRMSAHSLGGPDAPGAYDAVVSGVPLSRAAAMLRGSGDGFSRVLAEGAHGPEGAHLHIEVARAGSAAALAPAARAAACPTIYLRIVGGRRNPQIGSC
jgi:hypothetical protein